MSELTQLLLFRILWTIFCTVLYAGIGSWCNISILRNELANARRTGEKVTVSILVGWFEMFILGLLFVTYWFIWCMPIGR